MSPFRLPPRSVSYVIAFRLQNKRKHFEFLTAIFTYELNVNDKNIGKQRLNYLTFGTLLYLRQN